MKSKSVNDFGIFHPCTYKSVNGLCNKSEKKRTFSDEEIDDIAPNVSILVKYNTRIVEKKVNNSFHA